MKSKNPNRNEEEARKLAEEYGLPFYDVETVDVAEKPLTSQQLTSQHFDATEMLRIERNYYERTRELLTSQRQRCLMTRRQLAVMTSQDHPQFGHVDVYRCRCGDTHENEEDNW
jgi:hypothetical protein